MRNTRKQNKTSITAFFLAFMVGLTWGTFLAVLFKMLFLVNFIVIK